MDRKVDKSRIKPIENRSLGDKEDGRARERGSSFTFL